MGSGVILVDGPFEVLLLVLVGLADVQEEVVVGPEDVEDLVAEVDEDGVDRVPVQAVGHLEALVLPTRHLLVEFAVELLLPSPQTHPSTIIL